MERYVIMNKYKLDKTYSTFLIRSIICFSLLPISCVFYVLWLPFHEMDVIKNYAMELLVNLLGFIIGSSVIILSFSTIFYTISLVVRTTKQIKKENSQKLLKKPKFVLACTLSLIATLFSVYSFFKLFGYFTSLF